MILAIRSLIVAAALVAFNNTTFAANLTVTVQRVGNNKIGPLANAQVCVASSSGVLSNNTNTQGTVVFTNPPQVQLTVTASATGFTGQSIQFTMGTTDRTESFILQAGSGGPACIVTSSPPPVTVSKVAINPTSVTGGTSVQGTVTLSAAAPQGGTTVTLSSSDTTVAFVLSSIQVSAGSNTQTFAVTTKTVASSTVVKITATAGGVSESATVTVNPAPPPVLANLRVLVGTSTTPISGAAVCVTPSAGTSRSAVTDLAGNAVFDGITQGATTITVSKSGFTGQSHTSTLPAEGGTARFIMTTGTGGPICGAQPPPPPSTPPALIVSSFDWHVNRQTPLFFEVALAFSAATNPGGPVVPTAYRVGETADLSSKPFIPYQGGVALFQIGYRANSLTAFGQRTLFLQVRQGDLISNVKSKAVNLESHQSSEFRLTGADLSAMLSLAQQNGFPFRTSQVSVTQSVCSGVEALDVNSLSFNFAAGGLRDRTWIKVIEANLLELSTRRFTPGWRVTSIEIDKTRDVLSAQTITGASDGDGFRVTITLTEAADPNKQVVCLLATYSVKAIVLEGPGDDMALDQTKRWKNMFPSN